MVKARILKHGVVFRDKRAEPCLMGGAWAYELQRATVVAEYVTRRGVRFGPSGRSVKLTFVGCLATSSVGWLAVPPSGHEVVWAALAQGDHWPSGGNISTL
jgi:hypothetical protein